MIRKWKRAENLWRQNSWERKHFVRREIATKKILKTVQMINNKMLL